MANSLNTELTGKKVLMEGDCPEPERTVTVTGGFGASPVTAGTTLFATDINGQSIKLYSMEVEKIIE